MQIDDPTQLPRAVERDDTRREILAMLTATGLAPAQGIEAMLERWFPNSATP